MFLRGMRAVRGYCGLGAGYDGEVRWVRWRSTVGAVGMVGVDTVFCSVFMVVLQRIYGGFVMDLWWFCNGFMVVL